jgi:adenylate cyclase
MLAMRREDGTYATPQLKKPATPPVAGTPNWMWPLAATVVCLVAIGVGGFLYFTKLEMPVTSKASSSASNDAAPTPSPSTTPVPAPSPAPATPGLSPPSPPPPSSERFAIDSVPFVGGRARLALANEYMPAADYKAFAINIVGYSGFVTAQQNEEAAKNGALEQCQKHADTNQSPRKCEIYAIGTTVVYPHGRPPVPPLPWIRRDPSTEKPFAAKDMPLVRDPGKARLESSYTPGKNTKSVAVGREDNSFTISPSTRSRNRRAETWKLAGPLPASPA